jgi:ABC-type dipeptide/oligopeptide/nickel transport system permease subunit
VRALLGNRVTILGLVIVVAALLLALVGPFLNPFDPNDVNPLGRLQGPSAKHWLGTDQFGRDILSRIISGAAVSLGVSVSAVAAAMVLGVSLGTLAGYFGGLIDDILMRIVDIVMAFPYIVLAIALAAALGPSTSNVVLIIAIIRLPMFARVSRGAVLAIRENDFVSAARALGSPQWRVILRHILPNSLTSIVVVAALSIAAAINTEAAISFLGLGISPPQASWGNMLADAQNYILTVPSLGIAPGVVISVTVLGFQLFGDGLRDLLDPRLRAR